MPTVVEIEGDIARIVRHEVVRQVALADLMPAIERRYPITIPVLPDRTRLVHWDPSNPGDQQLTVFTEMPPAVRTITMQDDAGRGRGTYRIALPYTVFRFSLSTSDPDINRWSWNDYSCFFAKEPLRSTEDLLMPALLPNVFADGRICFGTTGVTNEGTLAERIDGVMNAWYLSNFNNNGHVRTQYLPWGSTNFTRWVTETADNPLCWRSFPEFEPGTPEYGQQEHTPVKHMLTRIGATRTTPLRVTGSIPELAVVPTFGAAEDWLRGLTETQRTRLRVAMDNLATPEAPDAAAD